MKKQTSSLALPRWRISLHRIGYVTTAIVFAQLCFVGFLVTKSAIDDARREAASIASTKTSIGPLRNREQDKWVRPHLIKRLAELPPIADMNRNGLRFVVTPSFGYAEYALSLSLAPGSKQAEGHLRVNVRDEETMTQFTVQTLEIRAPRRETEILFRRVDTLTRNYGGSGTSGCLDGTPMAYERVVGKLVWSGEGNCEKLYKQLKSAILTFVRKHVASPLLPTEDDWHHMGVIKI